MMRLILSLILSLSFGSTALAAKLCAQIFSPYKVTAEVQKHIDATILDLAKFRIALDVGMIEGKTSMDFAILKTNYDSKEKELALFLQENGVMSRAQLQDRIKMAIKKNQALPKKKSEDESVIVKKQLKTIESKMVGSTITFNRVKPGTFEMGEPGNKKTTQITKSFDMAATLTTQLVWRRVVEASKKYLDDPNSELNANPSSSPGDLNPVESVTYHEVHIWIDNVNELSIRDVPELYELFPGFKKGDRFRLPTEAEWEFVARKGGEGKSYSKNNYALLNQQEWTKQNTKGTQPVATKSAMVVDLASFYDFLGNVREHVSDTYHPEIPGGIDPFVPSTSIHDTRVVRGVSWYQRIEDALPDTRYSFVPTEHYDDIGFRLVRMVKR